jgi:hypothetical protein
MRFYRSTLLFLSGILPFLGYAQRDSASLDFIPNYIEVGGLANADRTPFWLQTNQFGIIPRSGSALLVRGGLQHSWLLSKPDSIKQWLKAQGTSSPELAWRFEAGAEVVANVGSSEQNVLIPQAYGALRYGNWELRVGRRKQWVGLADSTVGIGSYAWSGNALPIPKIQLGLTRFTAVPFTRGWLSVLGFYSDGWFEKGRPVTSELKLHQKQLYGRIGKPSSLVKFYGGFNHQVQWGGKSPYLTVDGQMPKGLNNYFRMVIGKAGIEQVGTNFDSTNRVGNHLGSIDLAFEINGKRANWFFYRQNIYEDGSLYYLSSIADGLNGLRIRRKNANPRNNFTIQEIVVEGMYTKSQGGPSFIIDQNLKRGKDNYFNNAQVRDGWSYFDRTIGTPFITPTSETIWKFPNYGDAFTSNNRVWVLHTGLRGTVARNIEWSTKLSYSSNAGVYDLPFLTTVNQFSGLVRVQARTSWLGGNTVLSGSVATDWGGLYPNSHGLMLSLRKEGLFQ